MLQDSETVIEDLTTEEEDQLLRSKKKVKRDGDSDANPDDQMSEADGLVIEEISMEDPPMQIPELMISGDEEMKEAPRKEPKPEPVRRSLWASEPEKNISYKERLMGFNGRNGEEGNSAELKDLSQFQIKGDYKRVEIGEEALGPWMYVHYNNRRRTRTPQNGTKVQTTIETKEKPGSRFQAIANADEQEPKEEIKDDSNIDPQNKSVEQIVTRPEKNDQVSASPGKPRSMKVKNKKPEVAALVHKKTGNIGPVPTEKPSKNIPKELSDGNKPKQRKPPDYEETLNLMRIAEKELRASGDPLPGLGLTQVYDNRLDGNFTVKSAYSVLSKDNDCISNNNWKRIWSCPSLERAKVFIWSVKHDSVMTNAQRKRRGFCTSDLCPLCSNEIETSLHALRDCGKAREVWKTLLPRNEWQDFFTDNLNEWLNRNLSKSNEGWNSWFPIVCWLIWKRRANWVFKNQWQGTNQIISMARNYMEGLKEAERTCIHSNNRHISNLNQIKWNPPCNGWIKLNVDGSYWQHTDTISCGGVLRDEQGRWIKGFTKKMGRGNSNLAEAWAVLTGLKMAWDMKIDRIHVEADSLNIVNMIKDGVDVAHPLGVIVDKIREFCAKDWAVYIDHVFRESNRVANALANWAQVLPTGFNMYDRTPLCCNPIIREDAGGVCLPRGFC
ncbi:non-LTR retroelement reverse transcriptase-like [Senna tora]|uniref:Non-LTR retroelement reverse transcriptase-like n=1 Tax=Senna tora TaxID=362788 RepID=A0A834W174_9FABA|nr:non-LTR retroelement reverse transcriptase-like [Senna tora]